MSLSLRCPSTLSVRSAARPAARQAVRPVARSIVIMRAEPATTTSPVESAIKEAEEACKDGSTKECAAAWDTVEEVSSATADKRRVAKAIDPLEQFCEGDPSADECRVYED